MIELNHIRHLQRLMEAALITDFSMKDIQAPIARRTIKIVSGIINFALFRESAMPCFQDLTAQAVCMHVTM